MKLSLSKWQLFLNFAMACTLESRYASSMQVDDEGRVETWEFEIPARLFKVATLVRHVTIADE